MPRFSGKQTDVGVPVTIDRDRYTEGDVIPSIEGSVALGEKPGNVAFPIQIDAAGYLKVVVSGGGGGGGTEYSDGDVNVGSRGTLIMGDDGANIQNIAVGANGRLQVEVVTGEYDGVQYQDGAAVASPFGTVAMGHDGSSVFPVVVDASGYLQVDIRNLPADTFVIEGGALGKGVLVQGDDGIDRQNLTVVSGRAHVDVLAMPGETFEVEGNALGKGVLIQGDDGTDRHNVAVDASGNVQVDIVGSLPVGSAAIGKLAANSGVDIGDVDVISQPADTFSAEDSVLGKGVLIQGDDGIDRHNVAVDVDGNVQVDIVAALPGGTNAIGKLAANSGVDIGDVDVISEPKATTLNSVADVTLAATATTQILGALATRLCALISNKKGNANTFRIGDSNAGATRGVELVSGATIGLETTEAIYGYNPGGAELVTVIWTED